MTDEQKGEPRLCGCGHEKGNHGSMNARFNPCWSIPCNCSGYKPAPAIQEGHVTAQGQAQEEECQRAGPRLDGEGGRTICGHSKPEHTPSCQVCDCYCFVPPPAQPRAQEQEEQPDHVPLVGCLRCGHELHVFHPQERKDHACHARLLRLEQAALDSHIYHRCQAATGGKPCNLCLVLAER